MGARVQRIEKQDRERPRLVARYVIGVNILRQVQRGCWLWDRVGTVFLEDNNSLCLPVIQNAKITRLQVVDRPAFAVGNHHIDQHQPGRGFKRWSFVCDLASNPRER